MIVPPGGGAAEYTLDIVLPGVPQPGDYLQMRIPDSDDPADFGSRDFVVRRTWWHLELSSAGGVGSTRRVIVECEYAYGPGSSEQHKRAAGAHESRGRRVPELETAHGPSPRTPDDETARAHRGARTQDRVDSPSDHAA